MNVKGFTYETWYNMPINLRTYYTNIIRKKTDKTAESLKKVSTIPKRTK